MYGRVDRGGSREGKKSLRKNKVLIHVAKTRPELFQQEKVPERTVTYDAPPITAAASRPASLLGMVDVLCNLGSRKLADEREQVVSRAVREGVDAIVVFSPDADKQDALSSLVSEGQIYAMVGVHPDNTKKVTDVRALSLRVAALRPLALRAEVVAVFAGIDATRDVASIFPQEKLLSMLLELAAEAQLPAVLTCTGDAAMVDKVASLVRDSGVSRIALVHFGAPDSDLSRLLGELEVTGVAGSADDSEPASPVPVYYIVTGTICDSTELGDAERARVRAVPIERLLLATDSPHFTPQIIPDAWIRERRNEPANLPYILKHLAHVLERDEKELAATIYENTLRFFNMSVAEAGAAVPEPSPQLTPPPAPAKSPSTENATVPSKPAQPVRAAPAARPPVERPQRPAKPTGPQTVQYACKRCRFVLFEAADVVPHQRLAGGAGTSGNECQTLFADVKFATSTAADETAAVSDDEDAGGEASEAGRLSCPKCQCRLGRTSRTAAVACSCGAKKDAPAFAFARKKLDVILPIEDAQAAMAALSVDDERRREEEEEDSSSSEDERRKKSKKKVKKTNAANFSSFRNKSYGVKAPKKEKGAAAANAEDE